MKPRVSAQRLPVAIAALLVVLLAVLAALQWRWIGAVSSMQRQRMRASLLADGSRLAEDFDREVTRVFLYFHPQAGEAPGESAGRVLRQYEHWQAQAPYPGMVRDVFLVRPDAAGGLGLSLLRPRARRFEPVPWPAELGALRQRFLAPPPPGSHARGVFDPMMPLAADIPALVIPLVFSNPAQPRRHGDPMAKPHVVVRLDLRVIAGEILPALARRHFGGPEEAVYDLAVLNDRQPARVLFLSDPRLPASAFHSADVRVPMFGLRPFEELHALGMEQRPAAGHELPASREPGTRHFWPRHRRHPEAEGDPPAGERQAGEPRAGKRPGEEASAGAYGAGERHAGAHPAPRHGTGHRPAGEHRAGVHGTAEHPAGEHMAHEPHLGETWWLALKHRDGSLEEAVASMRRHNLGVSAGILALLAATAGLMMATTQRAQRLARQQIEFVASLTHELHTPLTAIRSAGQNLADGVAAEPAQVKRYGALIESEGRRLSDLVGQALEMAGIHSGRRVYHPQPLSVGEAVDGALDDCRWLLEERRIAVEKDMARGLPAVLADPMALRRALRNLIENGVKHGSCGGWIGVRARRSPAGEVEITVSDRGPGIRREDLPRVFEPFFRGRDASAGGVPGSGLGLSLVRHVATAHGGRVAVASQPGGGSAFTLHLPTAAPGEAAGAVVEEPV
jgi:signal transduction histidine kinase